MKKHDDDKTMIAHFTLLLAKVEARVDKQAQARGYFKSACDGFDDQLGARHPYVNVVLTEREGGGAVLLCVACVLVLTAVLLYLVCVSWHASFHVRQTLPKVCGRACEVPCLHQGRRGGCPRAQAGPVGALEPVGPAQQQQRWQQPHRSLTPPSPCTTFTASQAAQPQVAAAAAKAKAKAEEAAKAKAEEAAATTTVAAPDPCWCGWCCV